jgi:N-terminal half of MaoC dehydratase
MTDKTLDCSDIDRYLGKPIEGARLKDPIGNLDIKRWAHAMRYPNRLHYDNAFAVDSRYGRLIAPQSFAVACDDGHGSAPSCVGRIPESHLLFGGDEWWFYGPRVAGGDMIHNERIPFDYAVKETKFAGPTCFQRGDNHYYNQLGDKIATQRSTSIRYRADLAREMGGTPPASATEDPEWTDKQLAELEDQKFEYIKMMHELGHAKRYWDDVKVGDKLPTRVIGPHSIASFTTEWRAYIMTTWGGMRRRTDINLAELGFTEDMAGKEMDAELEKINPEQTDGAYIGPSRGHLFPKWARYIGMPRGYGYGASMGAWILDYLAGWAGEWGMVVHSNCSYRGPAFTGDVTIMNASVVNKMKDEEGRHVVQVDFKMSSQTGTTMATAKAEIQLPQR